MNQIADELIQLQNPSNITTVPSDKLKEMQNRLKDQEKLIKCLGNALEGLAYYWMYDGKAELCGFDAEAGTKNFEPADHALCAYREWSGKK